MTLRCWWFGLAWLLAAAPAIAAPVPAATRALEPASAAATGPAARMIVLVRHGHYVADPAADPVLGPGLSPLGVAQARQLGKRLAALPARFDAFHVSPLNRARDTAAVVAAEFPGRGFDTINDLAECTPPTRRTAAMASEEARSLAACQAQLDRVFNAWFKPATGKPRSELFVCHGNVIRYLVMRALGVDSRAWLEMSIGHASITTIRIAPDGTMQVISVGDVGHLPPDMLSGSSADPERSAAVPSVRQGESS